MLKSDSGCTISATAVRSQANSSATKAGASSDDKGTKLVNLVVAGVPVANTPALNTVIELPGIGFVVLDEQVCDGGTRTNTHTCSGLNGSTGITVRQSTWSFTAPVATSSWLRPTPVRPIAELSHE